MCGIVGYIGNRNAVTLLADGLERLEYRGYDSVGIAVIDSSAIQLAKCRGRVIQLKQTFSPAFRGSPGIAHTRWATHGDASDRNAHPHCDTLNRFAIVHNGIIENAAELRDELRAAGVTFRSDTDSEILAHLIARVANGSLEAAVRMALRKVVGTYALGVIDSTNPDYLVIARQGSPVMLGIGDNEMFFASDAAAFSEHTQRVVHLDDGEIAVVRMSSFETSTLAGKVTVRPPIVMPRTTFANDKGKYKHYMRQEIAEQPAAVRRVLGGVFTAERLPEALRKAEISPLELLCIRRMTIIGCGSAYNAGCLGAHLVEQLTGIPVQVESASEFFYRHPPIDEGTLYIAVSQSGETFDTIQAIQHVKREGGRLLAIVNNPGSTIARLCGRLLDIQAGPEVAVVSTKTFTCTALTMALLAMAIADQRDTLGERAHGVVDALNTLADQIEALLSRDDEVRRLANHFHDVEHAYFLGRGAGLAVATEASLKMKEVSYLHAESYPAGELKHGPLALISPAVPSVMVIPKDALVPKNISTLEEIKARRGPIFAITGQSNLPVETTGSFVIASSEPVLEPILLNIPLQLLAYYVALDRGRDIDRPRNLAKSVTVA